MAFIPSSSSVVAFQSDPTKLVATVSVVGVLQTGSVQAFLQSSNASIITVGGGTTGNSSVTAYQGGAWSTSITGGYSNVIGSVLVTGSVAAYQGTNPWIVNVPSPSTISYQAAGSIQAVNMPSPSVIAYQAAGSILAVSGSFSAGNTSVTAFQGGAWSTSVTGGYVNVIGSIALGVGNTSVTQAGAWNVNVNSILGTYVEKNAVTPSAIGIVPLFKIDETNSVLSAVSPQSPFPIRGSVAVLQGTNPFFIQALGSILTIQTTSTNVSVVGASVTTLQGTNPWIVNATGSILAALNSTAASVIVVEGTYTRITSVMNTVPSSMMVGASIIGLTPVSATQITSPWVVNVPTPSYLSIQPGGSVMNVNISGSVAAAITNFTASVAANINVISASIAVNQGTNPWVIGSIVGTYQEDQAASTSDKGLFVLHVRNDTLSSVTNADLDYSALSVGPVGEMITANSPITKWVSGATSVMNGVSVQVLAGPGASIFSYITGINVINESATATRVTITQGLGAVPASMVTWLIAPAGGGSNNTYLNPLKVLINNGISASISTVASVYVTITGFTSKT